MDLKEMAVKMAMQKLGGGDEGSIGSALAALTGDGDGFDLGDLTSMLSGGGLGSILESWLGDGNNDAVSADQLTSALGADKVKAFASQLGIDESDAAGKLTDILPDLIDKGSQGGSLIGDLGKLASRFL